MRFHSLLLSAANRVPFVAVAYDTKCWRFIEENDYPHAIELEKLETEALLDLYENALHSKKQTAALLDTVTKRTYKEAEEALRTLSL
jgi:polysaccharide pyruvyl transferase WcaK-like protein